MRNASRESEQYRGMPDVPEIAPTEAQTDWQGDNGERRRDRRKWRARSAILRIAERT